MGEAKRRLTREQVRAVDRICIETYGIPGLLLMEHAALALKRCVHDLLPHRPVTPVLIVCGGGNNGGDGYALARLLHLEGWPVRLLAATPFEKLTGDAEVQARICHALGLPTESATPERIRDADVALVVDALLGTGLTSPPRDDAAGLIRAINALQCPVLAVDLPSGLDADVGRPLGATEDCVRASLTCTFVAEKAGFDVASEWLGQVVVGDIGAPEAAVERAIEVA